MSYHQYISTKRSYITISSMDFNATKVMHFMKPSTAGVNDLISSN